MLEDDSALTDGLSYSLLRQGYLLETAGTISEAKEMLLNQQYDLLLLDVTLPDGTGFEVCDWLRARANRVPIIFLTALDDEVNMVRVLDMGADDYITKPFKLSVLYARINAEKKQRRYGGTGGTEFSRCKNESSAGKGISRRTGC